MDILVKNEKRISDEECRERMVEKINKCFSDPTRDSVEFAIRTSAYHNNGAFVYPRNVCISVARDLVLAGFYCYWTKPSWKYDEFMDFVVSKTQRFSSQGNVEEVNY